MKIYKKCLLKLINVKWEVDLKKFFNCCRSGFKYKYIRQHVFKKITFIYIINILHTNIYYVKQVRFK